MLTLPGTSKLEINVKITKVGGLIVYYFVVERDGLKPLCRKEVFVMGREIIPCDDILLRHEASNKSRTLLCFDNDGNVSSPSTTFTKTPPKPPSKNTQT